MKNTEKNNDTPAVRDEILKLLTEAEIMALPAIVLKRLKERAPHITALSLHVSAATDVYTYCYIHSGSICEMAGNLTEAMGLLEKKIPSTEVMIKMKRAEATKLLAEAVALEKGDGGSAGAAKE